MGSSSLSVSGRIKRGGRPKSSRCVLLLRHGTARQHRVPVTAAASFSGDAQQRRRLQRRAKNAWDRWPTSIPLPLWVSFCNWEDNAMLCSPSSSATQAVSATCEGEGSSGEPFFPFSVFLLQLVHRTTTEIRKQILVLFSSFGRIAASQTKT
ncbi:hypothetical protein MRB53_002426 [Persea americana]|uniref:Uncharacterized protein n=1 Tax=Persea americana TaxID=3435 RepID=A0ACC2MUU2_PERAE|nr:hypothetical protein MRB53_002426 [Persea americana]